MEKSRKDQEDSTKDGHPSPRAPRYRVYPGMVLSKIDGDLHYVDAKTLMILYGVSPKDCIIIDSAAKAATSRNLRGCIDLRPRYDGDYTLPQPT